MKISSGAFKEKELIPSAYTCDGDNVNPRILFDAVPADAKSLALIVDDPDATGGGTFTHWTVWNISPDTKEIAENSLPSNAVEGETGFGRIGYGGPCPPKGNLPHRYFFRLYALNKTLGLHSGASRVQLEQAMAGCIIEKTEYIGLYGRK
ncbi:MAG: YbhB/YbcL family Raf kinase inhibitor-like protein [Candidatus Lloydbacteria bacterium]|nr:YbhB/YbcL family Raf kinase inhibitor-like protein [Candidatus Lloydbacteria bacterium]